MPKVTAFVARRFDPRDSYKIDPIVKFLESFRNAGFICETAEPAEVELVHNKVRSVIDASDVFVGIFTKRYPISWGDSGFKAALEALRGKCVPDCWCPPLWVAQESGYALGKGRRLVIFLETGVELPALQGDLEYIPYDPSNPSPAFLRASEMINALLAATAGTSVETVVRETLETKAPEASPPQAPIESQREGATKYFEKMTSALGARNWAEAESAHQELLSQCDTPECEVFWQAVYHQLRFWAGQAGDLEELRKLATESKNPIPTAYLADCLSGLHDYDGAKDLFLRAASLSAADDVPFYTIRAAECLRLAKRFAESEQLLLTLQRAQAAGAPANVRFQVLRALYDSFKEFRDPWYALSIGELALREKPEDERLRFSLGYAYGEEGNPEMAVYRYQLVPNKRESSTLNNLGFEYSNCGLQILSFSTYRRAIEQGSTLASSNLARQYLAAGAADEASSTLHQALNEEGCDPQVARTLAAVNEQRQQEAKKEQDILEGAEKTRSFLTEFGSGLLDSAPASIDGRWGFAVGAIPLRRDHGRMTGEALLETAEKPGGVSLALLGSGASATHTTSRERLSFSAELFGRSGRFQLTKESLDKPYSRLLLGHGNKTLVACRREFVSTDAMANI